jgi:hypothetical protein
MFLEMLKSSNEKEAFMDLAYWVATADGSLGLPEIKILDIFSQETGIVNWRRRQSKPGVVEECSVFDDEWSRKIAYSNLLAIGCVDEFENGQQRQAIEKVREAFALSPAMEQNYRQWVDIVKGSCLPRNYLD